MSLEKVFIKGGISSVCLCFTVTILYLCGFAWLVPILIVPIFYISLYLSLKEGAVPENLSAKFSAEKFFILIAFSQYIFVFLIPCYLPQILIPSSLGATAPVINYISEKIAYIYDDIYIETRASFYLSTFIGNIQIPEIFDAVEDYDGVVSPWFKINHFIFSSVNLVSACAALCVGPVILSNRKWTALLVTFQKRSEIVKFSTILKLAMIIVTGFTAIVWSSLFSSNFNPQWANLKIFLLGCGGFLGPVFLCSLYTNSKSIKIIQVCRS